MNGVFLDRDGVLIYDIGHLSRIEQLSLLPGAAAAVKRLNDRGVPVMVVTNQSVVARGLCSEEQVAAIHLALADRLAAGGAYITRFYYCPHHPTAGVGAYRLDCGCRKPKPGMLHQAASEMGLDLKGSVMVGDQITDLEAGWAAGCRTVLVGGSADGETRRRLATSQLQPDCIGNGLGAAVDWILQNLSAPSGVAHLEKKVFSL